MSDFTSQFLATQQIDPEMADYERRMAQAAAEDAAAEDSPLSVMLGPIGQKVFAGYVNASVKTQGITNRMAAGLAEAALQVYNTMGSALDVVAEAVVGEQPSQTTMADLVTGQKKPEGPAVLAGPMWNGGPTPIKDALTRLRDEARAEAGRQGAGEDSLAGNLTEGTVQFMVPFSMALKAMGGLQAGATAANIAKGAAAESVTMFGAFDPHAGRFADLMRAVSPDGLAANRYIDYLTNRENEGEFEGRFKNVVDSLSGSAAVAGALKVGGTTLRAAHLAATTPSPTKLQAQRGSMSLKTLPAKAEELAYHGTTKEAAAAIQKEGFDLTRAADGTVWFTSNPNIGEVAATGKGGVVSRSVSGLKLGGWDEMDKYSTDQLISMGYDGLKLKDGEDITYQIFNPEKLQMPKALAAPKPAPEGK